MRTPTPNTPSQCIELVEEKKLEVIASYSETNVVEHLGLDWRHGSVPKGRPDGKLVDKQCDNFCRSAHHELKFGFGL